MRDYQGLVTGLREGAPFFFFSALMRAREIGRAHV